MVSELFEPDDVFDYIIAMDQSNVDNIKQINPNLQGQLFKLQNLVTWKRVMYQIHTTQIILKVFSRW